MFYYRIKDGMLAGVSSFGIFIFLCTKMINSGIVHFSLLLSVFSIIFFEGAHRYSLKLGVVVLFYTLCKPV